MAFGYEDNRLDVEVRTDGREAARVRVTWIMLALTGHKDQHLRRVPMMTTRVPMAEATATRMRIEIPTTVPVSRTSINQATTIGMMKTS